MAVIDEVARPEDPAGDWMKRAACKGLSHLFFPAPAERPQARERREATARSVCGACAVNAAVPPVRPASPRVRLLGRRERGRAPRRRVPPDRPDRRPRPRRLSPTRRGATADCCQNAPVPTSRSAVDTAADRSVGRRDARRAHAVGRPALPPRRHLRRLGDELLAVHHRRRRRRAVPARRAPPRRSGRAGRRSTRSASSSTRSTATAGTPTSRRPAGAALRVSRPRSLGPGARACGAIRPSCCSTPTSRRSTARSTGTPPASPTTSHDPTRPNTADSAPHVPLGLVGDPFFDWANDRPPRHAMHETIIYEAHVRGLTIAHPGVPEELRGTYAGVAHPAVDRPPQPPRRHGHRADAGAPVRPRPPPDGRAACATTGATTRSPTSPRTTATPSRGGAGKHHRVQGDGQGAARRRHRGDPRRRLQPHGRGQPPRPDAVDARRRQPRLLPTDRRRSPPVPRLHRHRQQPQRSRAPTSCS